MTQFCNWLPQKCIIGDHAFGVPLGLLPATQRRKYGWQSLWMVWCLPFSVVIDQSRGWWDVSVSDWLPSLQQH